MTTAEFKKVGRLLKEVYAELEKEALESGVDIFSEEFITVRDALRLEVLKRLGFTIEEYRQAKELVAPAKKVDVATQLENVATKTSELESNVQNLHIPDEDELMQKMHQLIRDEVKPPVIQNNIVERTTVEKPSIVYTTVKETVNEEYDDSPLYAEIGYLNDKLDNLEIPETFDPKELLDTMRSEFGEMFEHNINTLGMPDFRKLAMGLQAQIDALGTGGDSLPDQTGNSGKYLTTDGANASWGIVSGSGDVLKVGTPVANQVGYWTGDGTLAGDAHFTFNPATDALHVHAIAGDATDGLLLESESGVDIGIMGMANTANATWYGQHNHSRDVEITDNTYGIILKSPDSTRWRITISNSGELIATSL